MIVGFSTFMPWVEVGGQRIETDFERKCTEGEKKHTFRQFRKNGQLWKPDNKLHFYSGGSPRNGGQPFNIKMEHSKRWNVRGAGIYYSGACMEREFGRDHIFSQEEATPIVDGVETFKFTRAEIGDRTEIHLYINEAHMFEAVIYGNGEVMAKTPDMSGTLAEISRNDGLSPENFLKWFRHSMRKHEVKIFEGQLIHWTPLRYVESIEATITDS